MSVSREGLKVLLAPLAREELHVYGWDRLITWAGSEDVLVLNVLGGNQLVRREKVPMRQSTASQGTDKSCDLLLSVFFPFILLKIQIKFLTPQGKKIADLLT